LAKDDIKTYNDDGAWENLVQREQGASNTAETKVKAQAARRQTVIDRGVEHAATKLDNTIEERTPVHPAATTSRAFSLATS